jgi:hypothetical protein
MSEEKQPTDIDEIRISNSLSTCIQAISGLNNEIQQYPTRFKQQMVQDMQAIEQERKERFAWVADPKLLDHDVEVGDNGETRKVHEIRQDFKSLFPAYLANSPGVDVASDLMVALVIQGAQLREAQKGKQVAEIRKEEIKRGEPSSDAVNNSNGKVAHKGIPSVFSLEGMPT